MYKTRGFMKDMDKTTLLHMRDDEGMTLQQIAKALGCSKTTVCNILGPMTPEERAKRKAEGARRGAESRRRESPEGGVQRGEEDEQFYAAA